MLRKPRITERTPVQITARDMNGLGTTGQGCHKDLDIHPAGGPGSPGISRVRLPPVLDLLNMGGPGIEPRMVQHPHLLAVPVARLPACRLGAEMLVIDVPDIRHKPFPAMKTPSQRNSSHDPPPSWSRSSIREEESVQPCQEWHWPARIWLKIPSTSWSKSGVTFNQAMTMITSGPEGRNGSR